MARSIAAAEVMGAGGLVAFHPLDLLAHDAALAFFRAQAAAALQSSGEGVACIIIFLYVYPTLLARLDALIDGLVRSLAGLSSGVRVELVTLTYHFSPAALPGLVRKTEADGRFVVYALPKCT